MNSESKTSMIFQIIKHKKCKKRRIGDYIRYSLENQNLHFSMTYNLAKKINNKLKNKNYRLVYALLLGNIHNIKTNFE
jgi:hypothetical protein